VIQLSDNYSNEQMLDMYIFETTQNIEQLENLILSSEKYSNFTPEVINEIFRLMHTIKGSSAMMVYNNISTLAHSIEDLFFYIRENKSLKLDYSNLSDLVLEGIDFIKEEIEKIKSGQSPKGNATVLIENNVNFLNVLKQMDNKKTDQKPNHQQKKSKKNSTDKLINNYNLFKAIILFDDGCEMENIRAFTVIHKLQEFASEIHNVPQDIMENDNCVRTIREQGFVIFFKTDKNYDEMLGFFNKTAFLRDLELIQLENDEEFDKKQDGIVPEQPLVNSKLNVSENKEQPAKEINHSVQQSLISVNVAKLDKLMDLIGELVIAEAMVIQNPDLKGLDIENFHKSAQHLSKIISELQDEIMAVRMVPLSNTFQKMNRIIRDTSKKLNKEVNLIIIGEETEVDKNIIEHISDPLMHLVRNSIDHGIESKEDREKKGKSPIATITLEARNEGSEVLIFVKDDGKGLDKEKILNCAKANNLLVKPEEEMTEKEIYSLIFIPGFSTKDEVTEISGRGVGLDVVIKNIETIGGRVYIDSTPDIGSIITIKIPLTLAIINGMIVRIGDS
jgi:two-component system chemotaxis sensor kinase CheA